MMFRVPNVHSTPQPNSDTYRLRKAALLLALPLLLVLMAALVAGVQGSVPVAEAASVKGHFYFYPRSGTTDLYYSDTQFQGVSVEYRLHRAVDSPWVWQTWQTNATWLGTYDSSPINCSGTYYSRAGHWSTPTTYDDATYDDIEWKVALTTSSPAAKTFSCSSVSSTNMTASAGTHPAFSMASGTYPAIFLSGLFPP